jgi:PAS domain S-box-containing protein
MMLRRKLIRTGVIVGVVVPAAMLVDYLVNVVLLPSPGSYTPASTALIATVLAASVGFYLASQQVELASVRDAFAKTSQEFKTLSDSSNDLVVRLNGRGVIEYVSPSAQKLLAYEPEALVGSLFVDLLHEEDRQAYLELIDGAVPFANGSTIGFQILRKGGAPISVEGRPTLTRDARSGSLISVSDVLRDVSQRRSFEAELHAARAGAEAASAAKSEFLATMSHEVRTPLNGVMGMAQVMALDELSPAQRERLDVIQQSGRSLLAILNDILDLSKIEAGKLELERSEFDLEEIVQGASRALLGTAQSKGVSLEVTIAPDALGSYVGDPTRIRQIISNLLSNALKFTDEGSVAVRVTRSPGGVQIDVADTGIGIDAAKIATLFERFVQADSTTTRRYGGTGLGLAICAELAHAMGAQIRVESRPGAGSTFSLDLPLRRVAAMAKPAPHAEAAPHACALRILAAEDNPTNQQVLQAILESVGADLEIVPNGQAAVDALERGRWDVVLMDVQMPVMDGPTASRAIRAAEAASGRRQVPIIALTANAMPHHIADYRAAGMSGFVSKPINITELLGAIEAATEPAASEAASR